MSPLRAFTLFRRVLLLDEAALVEVAGNRWSLVYGVLAAIIAGWARNYDRAGFPTLWWYLGPLISVEVAQVTALVFSVSGRVAGARGVRPFALLAIILSTAPLGWLYALPFPLLFGELAWLPKAILVTIVSAWRVRVLIEAYRVLLGLEVWRRALAFLVPVGMLLGLGCFGWGTLATIMEEMMGSRAPRDVQAEIDLWLHFGWVMLFVAPIVVSLQLRRRERLSEPAPPPAPD